MVGRVVARELGFDALFPHPCDGQLQGQEARVGLYATLAEAQRVVDLLRIKAAMDSRTPLDQVPLHLPLHDYDANMATVQYLRDHDMHTVWSTFHACASDHLPDAYAAADAAVVLSSPARSDALDGAWSDGRPAQVAPDMGVDVVGDDGMHGEDARTPVEPRKGAEEANDEEDREGGSAGEEGEWSEGGSSSGSEDEEEWERRRLQKEQGTGLLNALGRPLRVAAACRKLPLPAPGDADALAARRPRNQRKPQKRRQPSPSPDAAPEQQSAPQEPEREAEPQLDRGQDAARAATALLPRRPPKSILFPPIPASLRCGKCVNCQNPQRKRPCVLARRKLLELLQDQEAALAGAAGVAGDEVADAGMIAGGNHPTLGTDTRGSCEVGSPARAVSSLPPAPPLSPRARSGASSAALIASALHMPSRKQLYPPIPPSERCGQCGPCLNPRLKKACREARRRQLAAGIAPPAAQQAYDARGDPAAGTSAPRGGAQRRAATHEAALAAAQRLGERIVGCRIRVYWPAMRRWYEGRVAGFSRGAGEHHIDYDDGDQQDHLLPQDRFVLLDPPKALATDQQDSEGDSGEEGGEGGADGSMPPAKRQRSTPGLGAEAADGGTPGGSEGGAAMPCTPAAAAAGTASLLESPQHGAGLEALTGVAAAARLPAVLGTCCRIGAKAAAAAGVTAALLGRFMAAFSVKLSDAQRAEHAAFLLPLLEAECYEGVQACMEEVVMLCRESQQATTATLRTSLGPPSSQQQLQRDRQGSAQSQRCSPGAGEQGTAVQPPVATGPSGEQGARSGRARASGSSSGERLGALPHNSSDAVQHVVVAEGRQADTASGDLNGSAPSGGVGADVAREPLQVMTS